MKTVFLGGTTAGTTWRERLTELLLDRGVAETAIFNPHKPKGSGWGDDDVRAEQTCKNNKQTIILMHLCPAVPDIQRYPEGSDLRAMMEQMLGPTTMFEIGKYSVLAPERTVFVFDDKLFSNRRSAKVIRIIEDDITTTLTELGTRPHIYKTMEAAADWIAPQLT